MRIAEVRKATAEDASGIAFIHVRSWQVAYRGHMPDEFLDSLDVGKRANMWRELTQNPDKIVFVADDRKGNIVGFSALGPSRDTDADPNTAEVSAIYVHPEQWQKGIGRALLSTSLDEVRKREFDKLRCGFWKQTNEHVLFTNRSDLCRTVRLRMTTIGKALSSARFVIVLTYDDEALKIHRDTCADVPATCCL
jgi:L-amino acid N-acyltransferase YncA